MENSAISWTNHTANLWIGCQKVSLACDHCYAETQDNRWKGDHWGADKNRKMVANVWDNFKRFQKLAEQAGEMHTVFVGSMMDIFEKAFPLEDSKKTLIAGMNTSDLRDRYFNDIVPNTPNLLHLILTKRAVNIKRFVPYDWLTKGPKNVIYGLTVENQETTKGIDYLIQIPGRHFLSMEPLLGDVDLSKWLDTGLIDWIIVGGESGNSKEIRPMEIAWARNIRDQALAAGIPFHFKQWGQHEPNENDVMRYVKVKDQNALLDGIEYKEFPKEASI